MQALGLNVPPAIVITTRACAAFIGGHATPPGLEDEIAAGVAWLEERTGRRFGAGPRPLLVSVRSGAPVSMPGMMDTVLNLGINDETETALAEECGDAAFARNTHRRFLDLYAHIVLKAHPAPPDAMRRSGDMADGNPRCGRPGHPVRRQSAAPRRRASRIRILELPPRPALSPTPRHPRRSRDSGYDPGDGVRQSRRALWHWRAFLA